MDKIISLAEQAAETKSEELWSIVNALNSISSKVNKAEAGRIVALGDKFIANSPENGKTYMTNFFEKFKQYRGERHPMVYANDLDQFLSMIRNADLDMVKDGIVEEDEEPQYYLDMMDEYFGSDIGKNNNMDCDYHIWLFFTEKTQNILYNRVKQKREE